MNKTIIVGNKKQFHTLHSEEREFYFFSKPEDAYLFHLEQPSIDSYILDAAIIEPHQLKGIVKHIHFLNAILPVFIFDHSNKSIADMESDKKSDKNVRICTSVDQLTEHINAIPETQRKYNRVRWPVEVYFRKSTTMESKSKGVVTSISLGGCLIVSETTMAKGESIVLTLGFKDFNFLVEGEVARSNRKEFAVQFRDISAQTLEFIQKIINEKILVSLDIG